MIKEQRESIREVKYLNVVCIAPNGEKMEMVTRDVNEKGVALSIMKKYHNMKINDKVQLEFKNKTELNVVTGKVLKVLEHMIFVEFFENQRTAERLIGEFIVKCSLPNMKNLIMHTRDFSQNGLFVNFNKEFHELKENDEITIELFLPQDLTQKQKCRIVRIEDVGIALEFIK